MKRSYAPRSWIRRWRARRADRKWAEEQLKRGMAGYIAIQREMNRRTAARIEAARKLEERIR